MGRAPRLRVERHESAQLDRDIRVRREVEHVDAPRLSLAPRDERRADVREGDTQVGDGLGQVAHRWDLPRLHDDVQAEAALPCLAEARQHGGLRQPVVVFLAIRRETEPAHLLVAFQLFERLAKVPRRNVHPDRGGGHEFVLHCGSQSGVRGLVRRVGLHEHGALHAVGGQERSELLSVTRRCGLAMGVYDGWEVHGSVVGEPAVAGVRAHPILAWPSYRRSLHTIPAPRPSIAG